MTVQFDDRADVLAPESEEMLHNLFTEDQASEVDFLERGGVRLEKPRQLAVPNGPTEGTATVRVRRGQQFFRQAILRAYGVRCCITGIPVPRLLVASHIKPWRDFPGERLNPRNGLCLSSLHDAAFDAGLITLDEELRVVLSGRLRDYRPQPLLELNFVEYEGKEIMVPEKLAEPDPLFLAYHRDVVFSR
jgi:predicted restriction endonuclease